MRRVAILPLRAAELAPNVAANLNREAARMLAARNPDLEIVDPAEAERKLNDAGLVDAYSRFVGNYAASDLVDRVTLDRIAEALEVDAVLQGDVRQIDRPDGFFYHTVVSELTLQYALIGLRNGVLLWKNSATVRRERSELDDPPRIEDALPRAQSLALEGIPSLR